MAKLTDNRPFPPRVIRSLLTNKCCGLSTVRVDGYVALEITVTTAGEGCQDNQVLEECLRHGRTWFFFLSLGNMGAMILLPLHYRDS